MTHEERSLPTGTDGKSDDLKEIFSWLYLTTNVLISTIRSSKEDLCALSGAAACC